MPPRDRKVEQLLDEMDSRRMEKDRDIYDMEGYDAGAEGEPNDE